MQHCVVKMKPNNLLYLVFTFLLFLKHVFLSPLLCVMHTQGRNFEVFRVIFMRSKQLFQELHVLVCDVCTVWFHCRPEFVHSIVLWQLGYFDLGRIYQVIVWYPNLQREIVFKYLIYCRQFLYPFQTNLETKDSLNSFVCLGF